MFASHSKIVIRINYFIMESGERQEAAGPGPSSEAAAAAGAAEGGAKQQLKFAPKRNRGNIRKRGPDPGEEETALADEGGGGQGMVRQSKVARAGEPLAFSSKREGADEVHVTYESSRAIQSGKDNKVTSHLETETDTSRDAR